MIDVVGAIDERPDWCGCTSRWSLLEVARALKKDGRPKELIQLNLGDRSNGMPTQAKRIGVEA